MGYTVYILQSLKTNRFYCGQTQDIEDRLERHNSGYSKFTKAERPWKLVWKKEFSTRTEAVRLEIQIKKRGIGRFLTNR